MSQNSDTTRNLGPVLIIGGLFFVFGFVTWLNGSLIPFLQIACELTHLQAYFVTLAFYISYTFMALPASVVLRRIGYKNGLTLGLLVMVVGALIFIPAALLRMYSIFLTGLFVLGAGLTLLQTAANPYIVLIGRPETAAVRISIMGLLNKGAGIIAPLAFTAWVLGDISNFSSAGLDAMGVGDRSAVLDDLASRLIRPYLVLAGTLAVLSAYIKISPLKNPTVNSATGGDGNIGAVLGHPNLVLGVVTLFFYMGAEVIAGDTIGLLGRELGLSNFGQLTAYTMAFMMCGYAIGLVLIPRVVTQETALAVSAVLGLLLTFLIVSTDLNSVGVWQALFSWTNAQEIPNSVLMVALLGLANALVWPAVWPLSLRGLNDQEVGTGSALLIMGIAGGAIFPVVFGALSDIADDVRTPYMLLLPCYGFVFYYAIFGHKLDRWYARPSSDKA